MHTGALLAESTPPVVGCTVVVLEIHSLDVLGYLLVAVHTLQGCRLAAVSTQHLAEEQTDWCLGSKRQGDILAPSKAER